MQAVVLIPAFDRPEMLWLCLDHLARCPETRDMQIRVCVDGRDGHGLIDEFIEAVSAHQDLPLSLQVGERHTYSGNSFNVLNAYRDAYDEGADWVYLVEDDVMVSPEFFAWHQAIHRSPIAASVGVRNPGHGAYASLGVCLPRDTVGEAIQHAVPEYFEDMRGYCRFVFPPSQFDCEQDGLIARVLTGRTVAWADPPVCSHIGWYGYHRKRTERPAGSLKDRCEQVRAALHRGLPGTAPDVCVHSQPNIYTFTLSTVPGGAA